MIVFNGNSPLVICSGWSLNALRKPSLFFSRYRRTMNASSDVGVTLSASAARVRSRSESAHFSACTTRRPVTSSREISSSSMSPTRMRDVTLTMPPCL